MQNSSFLTDRIIWNLRKNGFPGNGVFLISENSDKSNSYRALADQVGIRFPIAVFADDNDCNWTLIGLDSIVSRVNNEHQVTATIDICEFSIERADEYPAIQCQWIKVKTRTGQSVRLWAPPGPQFLALASLILMLERLNKSEKPK